MPKITNSNRRTDTRATEIIKEWHRPVKAAGQTVKGKVTKENIKTDWKGIHVRLKEIFTAGVSGDVPVGQKHGTTLDVKTLKALILLANAPTVEDSEKLYSNYAKIFARLLKTGAINLEKKVPDGVTVDINGPKVNIGGKTITELMVMAKLFEKRPMLAWKALLEGAPMRDEKGHSFISKDNMKAMALTAREDDKGLFDLLENKDGHLKFFIKEDTGHALRPRLMNWVDSVVKAGHCSFDDIMGHGWYQKHATEVDNFLHADKSKLQADLFKAAENLDLEALQVAIACGADLNAIDPKDGNAAIHKIAFALVHFEGKLPIKIFKKLLKLTDEEDALDVNKRNNKGQTVVGVLLENNFLLDNIGKFAKLFGRGGELGTLVNLAESLPTEKKAKLYNTIGNLIYKTDKKEKSKVIKVSIAVIESLLGKKYSQIDESDREQLKKFITDEKILNQVMAKVEDLQGLARIEEEVASE